MAKRPSTEEYMAAFTRCKPAIKGRLKLLLAHHQCQGQVATMTEIAHMVGYKSFELANLNYGKLARIICEDMGRTPADISSESARWLATFVRFENEGRKGEQWRLTLYPEVTEAIERLGWRLNV